MGSRKQNRLTKLKELISERSSLHIKDAAELLDVSDMTIRRDIREYADQFEHLGGHIVLANQLPHRTPYDLGIAADVHVDEKRDACRQCLPYIEGENIIFVDCGTTLVHLIDLLPVEPDITIVCHALNVADRVVRRANLKLLMVGGEYHPPTSSFFGLGAEAMYSQLGIGTGFFSAAGLDKSLGATCSHLTEIEQKRAAMANTQRKILVLDESKIGKVRPARFAQAREFEMILTEKGRFEFPDANE